MVNVLEQLVDAIYETNRFSVADFIAVLSLVASWITIFFLIRENYAQKRPYVQVSFELIRSNLACVVIRNVGYVPVSLCKIEFDKNFIEQLPDSAEKRLFENGITNMDIFPGKYWVMFLGVIVPEIVKYENTILKVTFDYRRKDRKKLYSEKTMIDFKQYGNCLLYISEMDELRQVNKNMEKDIETMKKNIVEIRAVITKYCCLQDKVDRAVVSGYEFTEKEKSKKKGKKK